MSTKLRPGQKIKLKSVEELLGVSNEESAMDIESQRSDHLRTTRSRSWTMKRCRNWWKASVLWKAPHGCRRVGFARKWQLPHRSAGCLGDDQKRGLLSCKRAYND